MNIAVTDDACARDFLSIVDYCEMHARDTPDNPAFVFLTRAREEVVSFAELDRRVRSLAAQLVADKLQGSNILLIFSPGLAFIEAFVACLYAGAVPVPVNTPTQSHSLDRFFKIADDAQIRCVLSTSGLLERFDFSLFADLRVIATDTLCLADTDWRPARISPEATAFVQYTSGSTGDPKGAVITHENLMFNLEMIKTGFANDAQIVGVNWLPLFHDMGLVGNVLEPLYLGITCIHLSPLEFVQRPLRWLQAISDYKGTTSGGPTFAYAQCLARIKDEDCQGLDLSSWRLAYCGAEPIRHEVLQAFAERFAPYGFDPASFYPCYGMAETTLIVTGPVSGKGYTTLEVDKDALRDGRAISSPPGTPGDVYVSNGKPLNDTVVAVVNPETCVRMADSQVGEVWVSGRSVAAGYLNSPAMTRERFCAHISSEDTGAFYRTGDLGFIKDDELYITGRVKDLIVIRGRNYYPQDIERVAFNAVAGLRENCGVAFSISDQHQERLVIVHEVERGELTDDAKATMVGSIRKAVIDNFGISPDTVLLIKPKGIPKTSSGKLRRSVAAAYFAADEFQDA